MYVKMSKVGRPAAFYPPENLGHCLVHIVPKFALVADVALAIITLTGAQPFHLIFVGALFLVRLIVVAAAMSSA